MFATLLLTLALGAPSGPRPVPPPPPWQRTLADALRLVERENRPLLVAVNMDGESASERIVRENYRDPDFVSVADRYVCLVSSVFRHEPRDHDDRGRRIPCPRLGRVTCGEHIALEPILYDRYLGGQRIAPRHAVVSPDGEKRFDLFLLFDLSEIRSRLEREAPTLEPAGVRDADLPLAVPDEPEARHALWRRWAAVVDAGARARVEAALDRLPAAFLPEFLAALRASDAPEIDGALWILLARAQELGRGFALDVVSAAEEKDAVATARRAIVELLAGDGSRLRDPRLGQRSVLLPALARAGRGDRGVLLRLLAHFVAPADEAAADAARDALSSLLGRDAFARVDAAVSTAGGPVDLSALETPVPVPPPPPLPTPRDDRDRDAASAALDEALAALDRSEKDAAAWRRLGLASLRLAEIDIVEGGSNAQVLLLDAENGLAKAAAGGEDDARLRLARARVAYRLGRLDEEERFADAALAAAVAEGDSALRIEALRWLADAGARILSAGGERPPEETARRLTRTFTAILEVIESPFADATDRVSVASLLGIVGRPRARLAVARAAVDAFPRDAQLRNELNAALGRLGRPDLVEAVAADVARHFPDDGFSAWYVGFGAVFHAESLRRRERPREARRAYLRADEAFGRCEALAPAYAASCRNWRARVALGLGFAAAQENDRTEAARQLVRALRIDPSVRRVRDGLDREPIDLLDAVLEWRRSGESPVDPLVLARELADADAESGSFWPGWVADSELREALRAAGRGDSEGARLDLDRAIDAARFARQREPDDEDSVTRLVRLLALRARWRLEKDDAQGSHRDLAEAARLAGWRAPGRDAEAEAWLDLIRRLRERFGEAMPTVRFGR